jgi:hypothetical protein
MKNQNGSFTLLHAFFVYIYNPLVPFFALPLILTASVRLSFAIIASLNLFFVYFLTFATFTGIEKLMKVLNQDRTTPLSILPNKNVVFITMLLSTFFSAIFYFLLSLFNPLLAIETQFFIIAVPMVASMQKSINKKENMPFYGQLSKCLSGCLYFIIVLMLLSLIREPLGFATLSVPGGEKGIVELFNNESTSPYAVQIVPLASGVLFILGLALAAFRIIDRRKKERV